MVPKHTITTNISIVISLKERILISTLEEIKPQYEMHQFKPTFSGILTVSYKTSFSTRKYKLDTQSN